MLQCDRADFAVPAWSDVGSGRWNFEIRTNALHAAERGVFLNFHKVRRQIAPLPNLERSQFVGVKRPYLRTTAFALQHASFFGNGSRSAIMLLQLRRRRAVVDLALKLNVLAVFAVFLFIAAILLGAF
jgi:hypothetical protein